VIALNAEACATRTTPPGTLVAAGVDVGSSAVKVAIVEERPGEPARVLASGVERIRRRSPEKLAQELFSACMGRAAAAAAAAAPVLPAAYVATTGEADRIDFRTGHFYGMTTHARGALHLDPEVRAVIDVGSLHARAILMDDRARVLDSRMTSQCASGSGQFLENISRYLGITLEEVGPLSLAARRPEACSSICAVLAETDVINMVSRGISTSDILKGIHLSMAQRYVRLLSSVGARGPVLVTGGLAADVGLVAAMSETAAEQRASLDLRTHPDSVFAGAIGAALWGAFRARRLAAAGASPVAASAGAASDASSS
jgi:benzoyl-CoA reductase subunit D